MYYWASISDHLNAVWSDGAGDAWAVGDNGRIVRWDGTAWTAETSPTTMRLTAIWGEGPDELWAAGEEGALLSWNGTEWIPTGVTGVMAEEASNGTA